jgi:antitoxin MazE
MQTMIRKWGNSMAVRIPGAFVRELGIGEATSVEMLIDKSVLIIKPKPAKKPELKELLARISEKNCHDAVETGVMVGRETW